MDLLSGVVLLPIHSAFIDFMCIGLNDVGKDSSPYMSNVFSNSEPLRQGLFHPLCISTRTESDLNRNITLPVHLIAFTYFATTSREQDTKKG